MKKIALKNAARGTAFDYAGQSWILLENDDGRALCLSKDIIETRAFDEGNCNNFAVASSKEYLNGAYHLRQWLRVCRRRRDRAQHHRQRLPHRGLLLPPVPAERTRIQREPERTHTPAPAEGHRPEHNLLRGDQADRGLAEQLPPQNVRLSVLRAAFPGRNRPHSGLIKNIFAFLCIYS